MTIRDHLIHVRLEFELDTYAFFVPSFPNFLKRAFLEGATKRSPSSSNTSSSSSSSSIEKGRNTIISSLFKESMKSETGLLLGRLTESPFNFGSGGAALMSEGAGICGALLGETAGSGAADSTAIQDGNSKNS